MYVYTERYTCLYSHISDHVLATFPCVSLCLNRFILLYQNQNNGSSALIKNTIDLTLVFFLSWVIIHA